MLAATPALLSCCAPQVLEKADCEKLGMGLYLGVAEASQEPPKFIHLTYTPQGAGAHRAAGGAPRSRAAWGGCRACCPAVLARHHALLAFTASPTAAGHRPLLLQAAWASCVTSGPCRARPANPAGEVKKKVAIVGKGLTFDSGGYNLKAGAGSMIEMMKVRARPRRCAGDIATGLGWCAGTACAPGKLLPVPHPKRHEQCTAGAFSLAPRQPGHPPHPTGRHLLSPPRTHPAV